MFTCDDPYIEKFHYCNARVFSWYDTVNSIYTWELVSYNTSVCRIKYKTAHTATSRPTGELISIAFGRYAKYSATTWRQVRRFISEYASRDPKEYFSRLCKGYRVSRYGLIVSYPLGYAQWVDLQWGSLGGVM